MDKALIKYISIGVTTLILFFVSRNNKEKQSLDDYYIENISSDPPTLNPHICDDNVSWRVVTDIFEGLVCYNQQNEIELCGAKKYAISDDGLTYTFYLREDAKWSNGDVVTADDYIFSLRRAISPDTAAAYRTQMLDILNASEIFQGNMPATSLGVEKEGDYTLVIKLKNKNPEFIHYLTLPTFYPVHKATIEKEGVSWATKPENIISNGAYKIIEWMHNGHIILNKNPHYWNQNNVKIEKVKFLMIDTADGDYSKFYTKEEHMTYCKLPARDADWYKNKFGEEFVAYDCLAQEKIVFNLKHEKFQDKRVRKALSMTVDRKSIVGLLKCGQPSYCAVLETISNGAFLNELDKIEEFEWVKKEFKERAQEAKKLLEEAGYSKEHPLKIQLAFNIGGDNKAVAETIQKKWEEVFGGIVVCSLLMEEWNTFLANQRAGKYEMSRSGWGADYNLPSSFTQLYITGSEFNFMQYSKPEVDKLYYESLHADSEKDYITKQKEINKIVTCDYVAIPYARKEYRRLVSKHVKGADFSKNALDRFSTKYFTLVK